MQALRVQADQNPQAYQNPQENIEAMKYDVPIPMATVTEVL